MGFLPIASTALSALGGIGGRQAEKNNQANNMEANAEAIRYSPWTHMAKEMIPAQAPKGNLGADLLAGATSGLQQEQNIKAADAKTNYYNTQANAIKKAAGDKEDEELLNSIPDRAQPLAQASPQGALGIQLPQAPKYPGFYRGY